MAMIAVRRLHLAPRLADISFSLAPGEVLGIIGPNGSGKSSLLHCLAGLLAYGGEIEFEGRAVDRMPPRERARAIGLLPQAGHSAWSLQVEEIVALGRLPWGDRDQQAIAGAMAQTGVAALAQRKIDQLSGGEQARVWLARVLAGRPRLLLADEPIASLDLRHQRGVMQALRDYAGQGQGVMLAIHDLSLAARYCDRLCLMQNGRIYAVGTQSEVLTEHNLSTVFGVPVHIDLDASPPVIIPR